MIKHFIGTTRAWTFGIAALFALAIVPSAFAQGRSSRPRSHFPFHVGAKTLAGGRLRIHGRSRGRQRDGPGRQGRRTRWR